MKILATGGRGFIISLLSKYNSDWADWIKIEKEDLDLSHPERIDEFLSKYDFDILIHAGAMPLTSDCEKYPELTKKVNVDSSIEIAKFCKKHQKKLVFFSTEQVFNGYSKGPYDEDKECLSVTPYGNHKIECEEYIRENLEDYLILRFSWMFGMSEPGVKPSYNLLEKVISSMFYKNVQTYAINEVRGITYAKLLADNLKNILKLESGIYHVTASNELNTYEVAKLVAKYLGFKEEEINRYILPDHDKYSDRFRDFHMSNTKLKEKGIDFGTLEESFVTCLKDYGWYKGE